MARAILLIEDHPLLRLGLVAVLHELAPHDAVHEAATLRRGVELATTLADCDLVVYDWGLPDGGGLPGLLAVRRLVPRANVVVMSGTAEPTVELVALDVGACAYLSKSASPAEVKRVLGATLDTPPADTRAEPAGTSALALALLSTRQRDVARLLAAGRSNKEAAAALGIAEATVRDHVSEILSLLHVRNRAEAAVLLTRPGVKSMVPPDPLRS